MFNSIILELSLLGVFIGILWAMFFVFQSLNKKELLLLGLGVVVSAFLRLKYGIFAPIHPQDHYLQIFLNFKENAISGNFFSASYIAPFHSYKASGGMMELLYNKVFFFLPGFEVYYVYYISIALNIIAGILVFLMAQNIFKNKIVSFISFFIFASLPILIKFSATETLFIINVVTILLFINLIFFIFKREPNTFWPYVLLFLLFCANLGGRQEYAAYFIVAFFLSFLFFIVFYKKARSFIFYNRYVAFFMFFCSLSSLIYFLHYILPLMLGYFPQSNFGFGRNFFELLSHSLFFHKNNYFSYTPWLNSFFSPWYFFIFLMISPLFLAIKKYWWVLFIDVFLLLFLAPYLRVTLADTRFMLPLIFFVIPQVAFAMYFVFKKLRLTPNQILAISLVIIVIFTFQNRQFLEIRDGKRMEQDFLLKHLNESIPEGSLILTVAQKKYEDSKFKKSKHYKEHLHGLEFPSYLLPEGKTIDVMDIYEEYDSQIAKKYDHVFYYKSLYSHHEETQRFFTHGGEKKYMENKFAPEATKDFESSHKLIPIQEKYIRNTGYEVGTLDRFLRGVNRDVHAEGDVKIGLYKVEY